MSTLASSIITSVGYDLKLSATDSTARTNEFLSYMNRIIQNDIVPLLSRFKSDLGMKEWTTTESSAYNPKYTLPTDFRSMYALYAKAYEITGTLSSAASATSLVLGSAGSSSDDVYNGYLLRLTSGTYADQQRYITDYVGSTTTATTVAFGGTPSTDTYVVVEPFTADDELTQVEYDEYAQDYTDDADEPEVYTLMTDTSILIGPVPNSAEVVLYGLYFHAPAALTAATDAMPYNGIFDELIRLYTSQLGLLRDEYNVSVEEAIRGRMEVDIVSIIRERSRRKPGGGQSRIRGSRD
jgi:hypothetical protein